MVILLMHKCITRPQWAKIISHCTKRVGTLQLLNSKTLSCVKHPNLLGNFKLLLFCGPFMIKQHWFRCWDCLEFVVVIIISLWWTIYEKLLNPGRFVLFLSLKTSLIFLIRWEYYSCWLQKHFFREKHLNFLWNWVRLGYCFVDKSTLVEI